MREGRRRLGEVGYELAFYREAIRTLHGDVVRGPTYGTGTIFNHGGVELRAGDALYLQVPTRAEEIELIVADAGNHRAREVITGTEFHQIPSRA